MKKLAIYGCGKLAHIVLEALLEGLLEDYQLVATYSRTFQHADDFAKTINKARSDDNCQAYSSLERLLEQELDFIVEMASPKAMKELAVPALSKGISIVTLSMGALADQEFYEKVKQLALRNQSKIYIASGAIGGLDLLNTASLMGRNQVFFHSEKNPNAVKNTAVYHERLQEEQSQVFYGSAREAIQLLPTGVNVSIATALASMGTDKTKVAITTTPGYVGDEHRIEIRNDQIKATLNIYSQTAEIAGWSVVHVLRNITSPIVF